MPTIARVRDPEFNLYYGYMFIIKDYLDLISYWIDVRLPKSREEFADAVHAREVNGKGDHATCGMTIIQLAHMKEVSLIDALAMFNDQILNAMMRVLKDRGRIAINRRGGFFGITDRYELTYEEEIDKFVLPGDEIRVIKWENGTHYYAKIGDIDVSWEGKDKWDTKEEAEKAASEFKKQI